MKKLDLHTILAAKWEDGTRPKDLFDQHISGNPEEYVADIVDGLGAKQKKVQGGCAELASLVSEHHPEAMAGHLDLFVANLDAKAPILRWEAVCTLGNLASVDRDGKIPPVIGKVIDMLDQESIVLQGHAVRALTKIIAVYPDLAPQVLEALVGARDRFPGNRVGFLVEAMAAFADLDELASKARAFAEPFAKSEIKSVATKARKTLKKLPT